MDLWMGLFFTKKKSTQENCHQKTKVKILIQKYSIHPYLDYVNKRYLKFFSY